MSFVTAKKCFTENAQLINSQRDPVQWNLNNGLYNLTMELERKLRDLEQKCQALQNEVRQLQR